jgi:hypothetical protein
MRNMQILAIAAAVGGAVGGLALLAGCGSGSTKPPAPAGLAGLSAKKIVSEATAAATAASWAHADLTAKAGPVSMTGSGVIGASGASETLQVAGAGHATELMLGGVGYVRGSSAAVLNGFLQLPAADSRLAHRWIVFRPGDPGYQQVVSGSTLGSFLTEIMPTGLLTKTGRTTMDGQAVFGVRGKAPASDEMPAGATDTVYIAATGKPLPVACVERVSTAQVSEVFSQWGQAVTFQKPPHTVPAWRGSSSA